MNDPVIRDNFAATRAILLDQKPQTIPLLNVMKFGKVDRAYLYNDTVLLRCGDTAYLSSDCEEDLCVLLQSVENPEEITNVFCAQEDWIENATLCFQCDGFETYYQFVAEAPLPEYPCAYEIRPIGKEQLETVCSRYSHYSEAGYGKNYLEKRLEAGASFGAFDGETMIGFIFTHEDWSMGGLDILPEYRGKGIAKALESKLVSFLLEEKKFPYCHCHVGIENKASLQLQFSLGLTFCDENAAWLWRTDDWVDPKQLEEEQEAYIPKDETDWAEESFEDEDDTCGHHHHRH